jgi:hypothetical protein
MERMNVAVLNAKDSFVKLAVVSVFDIMQEDGVITEYFLRYLAFHRAVYLLEDLADNQGQLTQYIHALAKQLQFTENAIPLRPVFGR